ncbi:MAG: hypothetical protein V3W31_00220 [Thermodesulfobacteriota bacterium]
MNGKLDEVRPGLVLAGITLCFGIALAIAFGVAEDAIKTLVRDGVAANPDLHDEKSPDKIWRWWQRAHFHATGIGAFTLALIAITALSDLSAKMKRAASLFFGVGSFYPLAWFFMALLGPSMGRSAAHHSLPVEAVVYLTIPCLLAGLALLFSNVIFGWFSE